MFAVIKKIITGLFVISILFAITGCVGIDEIKRRLVYRYCSGFYNVFGGYMTSMSILNNFQSNVSVNDIKDEMHSLGTQEKAITGFIGDYIRKNMSDFNKAYDSKYTNDRLNKKYDSVISGISTDLALLDSLDTYNIENFSRQVKVIIPQFIESLPSPLEIMQVMLPKQYLHELRNYAVCSYLYTFTR